MMTAKGATGAVLSISKINSGAKIKHMIRHSLLPFIVSAVFVLCGATASADPTQPVIPPAKDEGGVNIPGMKYGVNVGKPCDRKTDTFGRDILGSTLVCVTDYDDTDKPATVWVRSAPLAGVRQPGASCYGKESNMVALSPQGETMVCAGSYDPERKKDGKDYVWTFSD